MGFLKTNLLNVSSILRAFYTNKNSKRNSESNNCSKLKNTIIIYTHKLKSM